MVIFFGCFFWYHCGYTNTGVICMFKIQKMDKNNKQDANIARTIRFPQDLFDDYTELAQNSGHSFNSLVLSAMRYAYNNLEIDDRLQKH